jgi:hypothetical protein
MGIISRSADLFYTYKFIRLLTTPWKDTAAFELGIIDNNGKLLTKPSDFKTNEQKDAYTFFDRLVFNIKRLLEKVPGGSSKIATYGAALFLLRETAGLSDKHIQLILKSVNIDPADLVSESTSSWYILGNDSLAPGVYSLVQDIASPRTGDMIAHKSTRVIVDEGTMPAGHILSEPIYKVKHIQTKQEIFVTATDIMR